MKNITIIGLGLIGGSIARSLKLSHPDIVINGVDHSEASIALLKDDEVITQGFKTLTQAAITDVDTIVIATPPQAWDANKRDLEALNTGHVSLITDVGSIKQYAIDCFKRFENFIASHPIAGSQFSGAEYSVDSLFQNKRVILTPHEGHNPHALKNVQSLWEAIGGTCTTLSPEDHDTIYAAVSHLPQIVAYCIADSSLNNSTPPADTMNFLRLAGSSPDLWIGIFKHNPLLCQACETFLRIIGHINTELKSKEQENEAPSSFSQQKDVIHLLPRLIASCLISTVTLEEHKRPSFKVASYAGSGFVDMTYPAMTPPEDDLEEISNYSQLVTSQLDQFEQSLRNVIGALKTKNWDDLYNIMAHGQSMYIKLLN